MPKSPVIPTEKKRQEKDSSSEEEPRSSNINAADGNTIRVRNDEDLLHKGGKVDETGQAGAAEGQHAQESEQSDNTTEITNALLLDAGSDSDISSHADSLDQANLDFKSGAGPAISFEMTWHK